MFNEAWNFTSQGSQNCCRCSQVKHNPKSGEWDKETPFRPRGLSKTQANAGFTLRATYCWLKSKKSWHGETIARNPIERLLGERKPKVQ
jgi:hypothetical protein